MATQCYQCTGEPQYRCAPNPWDPSRYKTCMDAPQSPWPQWAKYSECKKYCNPGPPKPGFRAVCWKKDAHKCVRVVPSNPAGGYYSECPLEPGLFDSREACKTGLEPIIVPEDHRTWIYVVGGLGVLSLMILFIILIVWLTY